GIATAPPPRPMGSLRASAHPSVCPRSHVKLRYKLQFLRDRFLEICKRSNYVPGYTCDASRKCGRGWNQDEQDVVLFLFSSLTAHLSPLPPQRWLVSLSSSLRTDS